MVNKVEITPNRIITRKSNGSVTFDTNNLYLKTDAGGSMLAGGFRRLPVYFGVMAVSTTNQVLPDRTTYGYPSTILGSRNLFSSPQSGVSSYGHMYVPSGVRSWRNIGGGDTRGIGGPPIADVTNTFNGLANVYYRTTYNNGSSDGWTLIGYLHLYVTTVIFFAQQNFPVAGPTNFTLDAAQMNTLYRSYGAGYYSIVAMPSNWASITPSSTITVNRSGSTNTGTDTRNLSQMFNTQSTPFLIPVIDEPPVNIDVAVTP